MNYRKLAALVVVAALPLLVAAKCPPPDKPVTQTRPCDETCTNDSDTVTLTAYWTTPNPPADPKLAGAIPLAEVQWTKGGVVQYSDDNHVMDHGRTYEAWEHGWADEGYPRLSITADENLFNWEHTGVWCKIQYTPKGSHTPKIIDYVQRGDQAGAGSVSCSTDLYKQQQGIK